MTTYFQTLKDEKDYKTDVFKLIDLLAKEINSNSEEIKIRRSTYTNLRRMLSFIHDKIKTIDDLNLLRSLFYFYRKHLFDPLDNYTHDRQIEMMNSLLKKLKLNEASVSYSFMSDALQVYARLIKDKKKINESFRKSLIIIPEDPFESLFDPWFLKLSDLYLSWAEALIWMDEAFEYSEVKHFLNRSLEQLSEVLDKTNGTYRRLFARIHMYLGLIEFGNNEADILDYYLTALNEMAQIESEDENILYKIDKRQISQYIRAYLILSKDSSILNPEPLNTFFGPVLKIVKELIPEDRIFVRRREYYNVLFKLIMTAFYLQKKDYSSSEKLLKEIMELFEDKVRYSESSNILEYKVLSEVYKLLGEIELLKDNLFNTYYYFNKSWEVMAYLVEVGYEDWRIRVDYLYHQLQEIEKKLDFKDSLLLINPSEFSYFRIKDLSKIDPADIKVLARSYFSRSVKRKKEKHLRDSSYLLKNALLCYEYLVKKNTQVDRVELFKVLYEEAQTESDLFEGEEAIEKIRLAIKILKEEKDSIEDSLYLKLLSESYKLYAKNLYTIYNKEKALEKLKKSIKVDRIRLKNNINKETLKALLDDILYGMFFERDSEKLIEYTLRAYNLMIQLNSIDPSLENALILFQILYRLGCHHFSIKDKDKAIFYIKKALEQYELIKDSFSEYELSEFSTLYELGRFPIKDFTGYSYHSVERQTVQLLGLIAQLIEKDSPKRASKYYFKSLHLYDYIYNNYDYVSPYLEWETFEHLVGIGLKLGDEQLVERAVLEGLKFLDRTMQDSVIMALSVKPFNKMILTLSEIYFKNEDYDASQEMIEKGLELIGRDEYKIHKLIWFAQDWLNYLELLAKIEIARNNEDQVYVYIQEMNKLLDKAKREKMDIPEDTYLEKIEKLLDSIRS